MRNDPPDGSPPDLTLELDPVELNKREAIADEGSRLPLAFDDYVDESGGISIPPGVDDETYERLWRVKHGTQGERLNE